MTTLNGQCNCIQAEGCGCPPIGYDEKGNPIMPVIRNPYERDPYERDPATGGVKFDPTISKPIQTRPLGGGGGIRMKPSYFGGQTNDYYKYVDPRIYQTGGANQTGTTPTANTNTTGTTTTAAATISDQLANFYNQNKILVLAGVAGLGYMLMKKK